MDWAIFRPKIATDYKRQCSEFSKPVNEAIVRTYQTKANDINLIFRGNYKLNFNQRMLDQDLILLLSCLQNYKENIQHIDLSFNEITNVGVQELSKFLQGTKSLQILQGCIIDIIIFLLQFIGKPQFIEYRHKIGFKCNKIGVEGGELIAEGIKDIQTLTHLNLNFNNLQTKGAMSIVEMLFNNKTILELNLANNGIDHDGVIAITSILNWKNNTLQILNLDNPVYHSIGQETAIHFGKMFHSNRGLEKISLQKHNFTCDAIYIITEHLLENNKLRVLDLTANRISFKGCEAIAKYLCGEYCVLESLILTSNRTGHYGAKAIAQALSKNRTLIHLDMVRNDIDDNGLKMIAESLETNDMLVSLKLYQNHFSQMALQAFHKYRMKNNKKQAERFWDFHTYIVDNHIEMAYVEQNIPYDTVSTSCSEDDIVRLSVFKYQVNILLIELIFTDIQNNNIFQMLQEIELTLDQILNQIDKHDDELDFSEEGGLVRIVAFDQLKLDLRKKIIVINLSKNRLKMIEEVNQFYNLRTLDASNNIIEDVKLKTQSLQMLNLQHNRLKRFPDCGPLSQLKYIDISHNSIILKFIIQQSKIMISNNSQKTQKYYQSMIYSKLIQDNDYWFINCNLIKFAHGYDIKNILEELKQLKIQTLNILRNPFLKKQPLIETAFAVTLSGILKTLNTKSIDLFVPDANFNIEEVLGDVEFVDSEPDDEDQEYAKQLCEKITKCINDPQAIVPCLRRIDDLVNRIIVQPNKADLCFLDKDPKKQQQIAEYIDSFLQNCFLFAQNQQSYVEQILKALAQLAIVRCLEIGRRCFQMVVEIVRSGTGMALIARNIIQKYSIPLLQQQKELEYVPTFVMEGILRTVEERDDEEMVPIKLAQFNFVDWLDQIMANYMKDMDNLREEQQQRDVLFLNFMAQLAEFQKFANEYHYRGIISKSLVLFKLLLKSELDEQYIGILYLINNSMKRSPICTKEVLESRQTACNFIKDVEDELRKYLFMFKKFRNSLLNPETKENKDTILLRYEKVGILIQVYGTIWKSDNIVQQQIKESFLVNELLQMATIPAIHPYLINAVAIYIRKLLKNKVIKIQQPGVDNNEIVKYICLKTHNCELLLHYLGGDYYVLMMKQLDPTIQKLTKNLSSLLNVKIHEVFRSIIKLLKFFSKNAIGYDSPISDICMEVSKNLDNNGRDEALFIVLATPSDMVRLAVVQCLLTIKVSQLDSKEIGKLVTLLGSYRNLGAGKTESVVANIMMILTKIVVGEKSSSREDFVTVFSQNATLYALDILERNQERDLLELGEDNSEYQEKVELSFGTNNFLKSLHCEPLLRENLKGLYQAQCMKTSLLNEDSLLTSETLDIDIERSFIGKQNTYLISVLFNRDALLPYKKVSDRILIRIAENLEMRPEDDVEDLSKVKNPGLYDFKEIQKIWKKIALDRRAKQTEIWDAMRTSADPFLVVENQEDSAYHISQHQLFYDQEGAINLLGFLVGRNQSAKSLSLKEYFLETFGNQLIFERMLNSINFYIREQVHEYCDNLNKQEEVKKLSTTRMNEKLTTIFQGLPMPTDPLRGFIKQKPYFNPNKIIHFPMFTKKALSITQEHITYTGIKFEERTITVCAYLRIVYALLGYCPQDQNKPNVQRQQMAEQLGQRAEYIVVKYIFLIQIYYIKDIRELTLICQWADWHNGNIGAKYLKIMNVILEYSFCAKEKSFIISFFVIAKAIRDMLDIISVKLQNEDKFPLTYDDLVLIKETCECMSKIASNLTKISYEDKIMETYEKDYSEDFQKLRTEERNQIATLINRQIDEYILLNLLPLQGFTIFLEIIVWDMQSEKSLLSAVSLDERFFKIKSQTRSSLIKLVGLYIVKCKSLKFQILSVLTKMEVFNKKFIRQSFIQEILEDLFAFDYQLKLQSSLLNRSILIKNKDDEEQQGSQRPDYYVEHFIKCYYQTQKGLNLPSLVVVTSKYFILCEADEDISKKQNPNIQFENPKLLMEFTSLKLIFKINKSQVLQTYIKSQFIKYKFNLQLNSINLFGYFKNQLNQIFLYHQLKSVLIIHKNYIFI